MNITPIPPPRPHAVGIISQSGALGMALAQAVVRGASFSHVMTSGNSCDVDMADFVSYLADDPACTAIACVFEGMASPERLLLAADYAWQRDKPLVVYKMATGEEGAAAAMSHTGSLAGSHAAYRAVFQRAGAVLVESYESLVETASFFAKAPPPKAKGAAVVAASGGAAIMAADRAEQYGVPMPQPGCGAARPAGVAHSGFRRGAQSLRCHRANSERPGIAERLRRRVPQRSAIRHAGRADDLWLRRVGGSAFRSMTGWRRSAGKSSASPGRRNGWKDPA